MVEGRRRLRLAVVIGTSIYIALGVFQHFSPPPQPSQASIASIPNVFVMCVLLGLSAWSLRAAEAPEDARARPAAAGIPGAALATPAEAEGKPVIEPALLRRLEQLMTVDRVYLREGLTIGGPSSIFKVSGFST